MKIKLNKRQKLFCEEYLIDMNAKQAAIRAGYKENRAKEMGYENLTKPHLAAYIKTLVDARSERTQIKADDVLKDLRRVADMSMGREPYTESTVVDGQVVDLELRQFNPAGANKALELLGKHFRLFADVVVHENNLNEMTDAELLTYEAEVNERLAKLSESKKHIATRH